MNRTSAFSILISVVALSLIGLIVAAPLLNREAFAQERCLSEEVQEFEDSNAEDFRADIDFDDCFGVLNGFDHLFQSSPFGWLASVIVPAESTRTSGNSQRGPPSLRA